MDGREAWDVPQLTSTRKSREAQVQRSLEWRQAREPDYYPRERHLPYS